MFYDALILATQRRERNSKHDRIEERERKRAREKRGAEGDEGDIGAFLGRIYIRYSRTSSGANHTQRGW